MNSKDNYKYCTECGAEIETGSKYCQECGEKIETSRDYGNILKWVLLGASILIAIAIITGCIGGGNYPDHAYQDNIDNTIHYTIPAGYKHIETKYIGCNGQPLKTALYKNKQGQAITVSKMSEGEMYIMGHGKKVPTGNTVKNPDGSAGTLKQEGNFYLLIGADNPNVLNSI